MHAEIVPRVILWESKQWSVGYLGTVIIYKIADSGQWHSGTLLWYVISYGTQWLVKMYRINNNTELILTYHTIKQRWRSQSLQKDSCCVIKVFVDYSMCVHTSHNVKLTWKTYFLLPRAGSDPRVKCPYRSVIYFRFNNYRISVIWQKIKELFYEIKLVLIQWSSKITKISPRILHHALCTIYAWNDKYPITSGRDIIRGWPFHGTYSNNRICFMTNCLLCYVTVVDQDDSDWII